MTEPGRKFVIAARALTSSTALFVLTLAVSAYLLRGSPDQFATVVGHLGTMWIASVGLIVGLFGGFNAATHFAKNGNGDK